MNFFKEPKLTEEQEPVEAKHFRAFEDYKKDIERYPADYGNMNIVLNRALRDSRVKTTGRDGSIAFSYQALCLLCKSRGFLFGLHFNIL